MPSGSAGDITELLRRWEGGTAEDRDRLFAAVYAELRQIAAAYMRRERGNRTLEPAALVNEAYLRLVDGGRVRWEDRVHFYGIAARVMRQTLVDYARKRHAAKRGRRVERSLSKIAARDRGPDVDVLALDKALVELAALDPRQAQVVELRYFGGMTEEEVAEAMALSPATIRREVAAAKFWLGARMQGAK